MPVARRASLSVAAVGVATLLLAASAAWACVPGSGSDKKLTLTPAQVRPGDPVTVRAPASAGTGPIEVRLDGRDGPVLGTLSRDPTGTAAEYSATFTIPLATEPGHHALTAEAAGAKWDPVLLAVARPDGTVPDTATAAASAGSDEGRRPLPAVLAVVALALGAAVWALRRRRPRAEVPPTVPSDLEPVATHGPPVP